MISKKPSLSTPGQRYKNFILTRVVEIPELQSVLYELEHENSGAKIIHIANDDPENLFCLSFQTLPKSSDGVAHILEHTVLCGSEKYPVKDPFFSMGRRSLNTFMNAFTGADFTCYPASSQVAQDFYNLLDVYIDSVFNPILSRLSFLQEGHRLEFSQPDNSDSPLEYKGIVYNEMKGAMASPHARLSEALHAALFPDVTYGVNSGGDPKDIPKLTYDELCQFHKTYYHPSRCLFYFYGNMPLENHLEFIANAVLDKTTKIDPLPPIPFQPRFSEPRRVVHSYPISPEETEEEKVIVSFGWLTYSIMEQQKVLALIVLEVILMGNDAAPLKMALLQSGFCKQATSFVDEEMNEIPWCITLKGCNAANIDSIEAFFINALKEIVSKGITIEQVESAIHLLEFQRSEIGGNHYPFGLSLFMRSGLLKQHGANPENGLIIHTHFSKLYESVLANPNYLSDIIQEILVDNPHFVRVVMLPDKNLAAKELEDEHRTLKKIRESLSPEESISIIQEAQELSLFQKNQEEEDIEVLPKISLNEIPLCSRHYPLSREQKGPLQILHHPTFTNDIIYATLAWDLPDFPFEDLPYASLLATVLTQLGSNGRDYKQNLDYIQRNTGGIGAGFSLNVQAHNHHQYRPVFHLKGKALHRKAGKLFPLMLDTLLKPDFSDLARLKEILLKHFTALESHLTQQALKYAVSLSASGISSSSNMSNRMYGLPYYWTIQNLMKNFDENAPELIEKLISLHRTITQWSNPSLILGCDAMGYDQLMGNDFYGLTEIDTFNSPLWKNNSIITPIHPQGRVIASPVAFIAKVFSTLSYAHPDAPALSLAAHLFDNLSLHNAIREKGGAYGCGAVNNATSGSFYFYSYRDPNIASTFQAFKDAVGIVSDLKFDQEDLEEAKLELIQSLDMPIAPGSQADLSFAYLMEGKTAEMRQSYRNHMLELSREQVAEAVRKHIATKLDQGAPVVFASRSLLEKENSNLSALGQPTLPIETV